MFQLGPINGLECPICGCDNHMVCEERDEYINEKGKLSVCSFLLCEECDSTFKEYSTFNLMPINSTGVIVDWEQHNSNFGEGKFV